MTGRVSTYPRLTPDGIHLSDLPTVDAIADDQVADHQGPGWVTVTGALARWGITAGPRGATGLRRLRPHVVRVLGHAQGVSGPKRRTACWPLEHVDLFHDEALRVMDPVRLSAEHAARLAAVQPLSVAAGAPAAGGRARDPYGLSLQAQRPRPGARKTS